jgi:CHAD domain-containing protein
MAKGGDVKGLSAHDEVREAAVKILWTRFDDMWAYRDSVLKGFDVDAVHDMRVASRRLRTAMQTFRPCFPRRTFREHYDCIKTLADLLGEVRDRDVLLEELAKDVEHLEDGRRAGVAGLVRSLEAERAARREALRAALEELDRRAYDRAFLTYLARSS